MKAMGNPILGPLWIRLHPGRNMLNLGSTASSRVIGTTIVNMNVPSEVRAVEVAHYRNAVVVGWKLVSANFKGGIFLSFDRPLHP